MKLAVNLLKLAEQGAPLEDIQAFLEEEGVQVSETKSFIAKFTKSFSEAKQLVVDAVGTMVRANGDAVTKVEDAAEKVSDAADKVCSDTESILAKTTAHEKALRELVKMVSAHGNDITTIKSRKEPEKPVDYSLDIYELKKQVKALDSLINDLVTLPRVPVFNADGSIKAVILKKV